MTEELALNEIYCMDCRDGLKLIQKNSVDLIVTDPPYYIQNLQKDQKDQTLRRISRNNIFYDEFDHFEDIHEFQYYIKRILTHFKRVLKPKGQVYMFFSYHHLDWVIKSIKEMGFRFYKPLIWYKPDTMGVFPNQYGCNYDVILWFRKISKAGNVKNHIGCNQSDVFVENSTLKTYRAECGFHPTPKPINIIRQLILNSSNKDDLILDPFMGSGTTAVACKQTDRNFLGFEISEDYYDIAYKRLEQTNLNTFEGFVQSREILK